MRVFRDTEGSQQKACFVCVRIRFATDYSTLRLKIKLMDNQRDLEAELRAKFLYRVRRGTDLK